MKLLVLVVLFKIEPQTSESLLSLAAQSREFSPQVLVWDNSPEACSDIGKEWLDRSFSAYNYHHCAQNWPLSRIYNEVISTWLKERPSTFSHLLLLDQDSILEPTFLRVAAEGILNFPDIGLFLPLVKANGHIVSPAHLFYFKGFYWRRPMTGVIRVKFKTAINSGMIIASRYLLDKFPGYPEMLSFYGTDTWFCEQFAQNERLAYVFDSTIGHNLARFKEENVEVKLWRHREEVRASRMMNSKGIWRRYGCILYTSLTCVRMALRFRDRRFLWC